MSELFFLPKDVRKRTKVHLKCKKNLFEFLNFMVIFIRIVKSCHVVIGVDCLDWVVATDAQIGSYGVQVLIEN